MFSIVIPVFNEQDTLHTLRDEINDVAVQYGYDHEIIFVDDGSSDASWSKICDLCDRNENVRAIRFRRNFGKAAALTAGFEAAKGDLVFTLDADLQDDPKEIPRFLEKISEGFDVVSGWKKVRHDPWHKVGPSRVFNALVSKLTGVYLHDHNCGFKCYRRQIFREVRLYGELHRFVPVLAAARGWKAGEVVVGHRAREHGVSKYGWWRIPKGFLDLLTVKFLTGFGQRPQHLLGMFGMVCFLLSLLGIGMLTLAWLVTRIGWFGFEPIHLHQRAIFYYSLTALILSAQFMLAGFLAEQITSMNLRASDTYSIAERAGGSEPWRNQPLPERRDRA